MTDGNPSTPQSRPNDLFISYSRRDIEFVRRLDGALRAAQRDPWVDWEDIREAEEWRKAIASGIAAADSFVYVISPDSCCSVECDKELQQAIALNKRIIPLLHREAEKVHSVVAALNWIFFRSGDDFNLSMQKLLKALDTDLKYVHAHTRLVVRAIEWEAKHRDDSYLLRGKDLDEAERWLHQEAPRDPKPTELHLNYIEKSREAEDAHQRVIAAGEKARRMVRTGSVVLGATLAIATVIGGLTLWSFHKLREARTAAQLEQDSIYALQRFEFDPLNALLDALQSGDTLKKLVGDRTNLAHYPTTRPLSVLGTLVSNIQEQQRLQAPQPTIRAVAMHPQGELWATAGTSNQVTLWQPDGTVLKNLDTGQSAVNSVSFNADGTVLAIAGDTGTVELWQVSGQNAGQKLRDFRAHSGTIHRVAFSPDGSAIATASDEGADLWTSEGEPLATLRGHTDAVLSVRFSADGSQLVTTGIDGSVRLWNRSGTLQQTWQTNQGAGFDAALSPDGRLLAVATLTGRVQLWNLQTQASRLQEGQGHQGEVLTVNFSPDGQTLISTGTDSTIRRWSRVMQLQDVLRGHQNWVSSAAFSPDGTQLLTGSEDGTLRLWAIARDQTPLRGHVSWVDSIHFSPDGQQVATAGEDGTLRLWSLSGQSQQLWPEPSGPSGLPFNAVAFSADGRQLAAANFDGTVSRFDLESGQSSSFPTEQGIVWSLDFAPAGDRLVTGGEDGSAILWDLDGSAVTRFEGHTAAVGGVSISPDGQRLATASDDGTVRLWTMDGQEQARLQGHAGQVNSVRFSPDGSRLVTAGDDGTVQLWNSDGELQATGRGHVGAVRSAAFNADGSQLVSVGSDGTVRFWDLAGRSLLELRPGRAQLASVDVSPDGQQVAIAGEHGTAQLRPYPATGLSALMAQTCDWLRPYLTRGKVEPAKRDRALELCNVQPTPGDSKTPPQ